VNLSFLDCAATNTTNGYEDAIAYECIFSWSRDLNTFSRFSTGIIRNFWSGLGLNHDVIECGSSQFFGGTA
jgi:hypothetical protein